jgi:uroporphyrinogen-III synthase
MSNPRVAVFRPDDERLTEAEELLESLDVTPIADPMLAVKPTEETPKERAHFVVLTSKTGVELLAEAGWSPGDSTLCCIGEATAEAARGAGWEVDRVPDQYSSAGLVAELSDDVAGRMVAVARSDHGSDVLTDGLRQSGAAVRETVLYRLIRPEGSGHSAELAADGALDGALFTSSLTVEHFLEAAEERGVRDEAIEGLNRAVVGTIGHPTRETAADHGIEVDVVPTRADFEALARDVVERLAPTAEE